MTRGREKDASTREQQEIAPGLRGTPYLPFRPDARPEAAPADETSLLMSHRVGGSSQILLLTLNRPGQANAYTAPMLEYGLDIVEQASADRSIAAAVVTGTGDSFCSGAELADLDTRKADDSISHVSRRLFDRWAEAPWPTFAAINGPAVGGGFEFALASDIRVCAPRAFFRLPELAFGLIPAAGGIRRLVAEVGLARVKELVLLGKTLDAAEALEWGLVSQIIENPLAGALGLAESASGRDPLCLCIAKMLIHDRVDMFRGRGAEAIAHFLLYDRRRKATIVKAAPAPPKPR